MAVSPRFGFDDILGNEVVDFQVLQDNFDLADTHAAHMSLANVFDGAAQTFQRGLATDTTIQAKVIGDAQSRFTVGGDGAIHWGGGAGATDLNLYRNGAGILRTDTALQVGTSVQVGSGAAATPSQSFLSDTDTGFYSMANDIVGATVGGTVRAAIRSTGVYLVTSGALNWVGGTDPSATADVSLSHPAAATFAISISSVERWRIGSDGRVGVNGANGIANSTVDIHSLSGGGVPVLTIQAGGNTGGDIAGIHLASAAGTTMAELWTDASAGVTRLKSKGAINFHVGATAPGFSSSPAPSWVDGSGVISSGGVYFAGNTSVYFFWNGTQIQSSHSILMNGNTIYFVGSVGVYLSYSGGTMFSSQSLCVQGGTLYLTTDLAHTVYWDGGEIRTNGNFMVDGVMWVGGGTLAGAGALRLANGNMIDWRNAGSTDDLRLYGNSVNQLYSQATIKTDGWVGSGQSPSNCFNAPNVANTNGQALAQAWTTYSTLNEKRNLRRIDDSLDLLDMITPYRYDHHHVERSLLDPAKGAAGWKVDHVLTPSIGFALEEVMQVLPEVVSRDDYGVARGMDLGRMTAVLWEAGRAMQQQLTAMRQELDQLKGVTK